MKERESNGFAGRALQVFPFVPVDATDEQTAFAANVEALPYWKPDGSIIYGVKINASFSRIEPLRKDETDALQAAIDRCWQWIDEQATAPVSESEGEGR